MAVALHTAHSVRVVRASPELPQGYGAHGILGTQRTPNALPDDRPMQTLRTGSKSSVVCVGKRERNTQKD